jgi:hypothetical protein
MFSSVLVSEIVIPAMNADRIVILRHCTFCLFPVVVSPLVLVLPYTSHLKGLDLS